MSETPTEIAKEFKILLSFVKGDKRFAEHFRYLISITDKLKIIDLFYNHVLEQLSKADAETEELRKRGYSWGKESLRLKGYYEAYLNAIYSFFENISRFTKPFFNKSLPENFYSQRKRFIEDPTLDEEYSSLMESLEWCDEIHNIRSESTHFLSGLVTSNQNTQGYWNEPQSMREGTPQKIDIVSIKDHVENIQKSLLDFIDKYGKIFIEKIEGDAPIHQICQFQKGLIGVRVITLNEFLKGHSGKCKDINFDCQKAKECPARKKALEDT